jgi:hypothetical protein
VGAGDRRGVSVTVNAAGMLTAGRYGKRNFPRLELPSPSSWPPTDKQMDGLRLYWQDSQPLTIATVLGNTRQIAG